MVPKQTSLNSEQFLYFPKVRLLCHDEKLIPLTCKPLLVYHPGKLSDGCSIDGLMLLVLLEAFLKSKELGQGQNKSIQTCISSPPTQSGGTFFDFCQ